ncbi:MAG: glycosyltransferase family 2 protein [Bacteroidales bacterium]|jgi:hypothetical protein|nr:glycosyltransferase family 2 protein [Bacteroidales bacterium]
MANNNPKRIGVVSMVRNDSFFITKWIDYYSQQVGQENLFLVLDGLDQELPRGYGHINVIRLPQRALNRTRGDRNRARLISYFARLLFHRYDIVIAHDIDEYLVIDPDCRQSFADFFQKPIKSASLSALGLDVGQHLKLELPIDPARPFLEQRSYAHVSARYTKAVVATRPLTWGSGFHRVKGRNFHIDPNLYLFHFGMVDYDLSRAKIGDKSLMEAGWQGHLGRRYELFELITNNPIIDNGNFLKQARRRQGLFRPLYAINKPGMLKEKPVIRIPERFRNIV